MRGAHFDHAAFFRDAAGNDAVSGDFASHSGTGPGIGVLTHSLKAASAAVFYLAA